MAEIDDNKANTLLSRLVKSFDAKGISIFGLTNIVARMFSTSKLKKGQRIETTPRGTYVYDNYGNLVIFLSGDVTNIDPSDPSRALGTGIFANLIGSLATSLTLESKTGKAQLVLSDAGNGEFTFIGDNGSGNYQITFNPATNDLTIIVNGKTWQLQGNALNIPDTSRIVSGGSYVRFFDDGGSNKSLAFYVNNTLMSVIDLEGINLYDTGKAFKPRYISEAAPTGVNKEFYVEYNTSDSTWYLIYIDNVGTAHAWAADF